MTSYSLQDLENLIAQRADADVQQSYTKSLLASGLPRLCQKVGEEAVETIIAALQDHREDFVAETCDLIYHLLVLLHARQVPLAEIFSELERRTRQSGLDEKQARQP